MLPLLVKRKPCYVILPIFAAHHNSLVPRCFSSSAIQNSPPQTPNFKIVDYLITNLGFSPDKAASASIPIAHLKSPDKPESVRHFLNQQGFSEADIIKIITWFPQILYSSPENTINPNLRALRNMGLSTSALTQIILSNPAALVLRSAVPRIMFWWDFLEGNEAALVKSFKNSSGLVTHDISRIIAPKMSLLQGHGLSTADIRKMVCNVPQFFSHSISLMEDRLKRAEELGFQPDSKTFLIALEAMVRVNRQTFQKKMDLLKSFGWSEDEFHSALQKSPNMVALSEKNLHAKMDFFLVEARCSISYISSRPNLLFLSLEKRLRPRLRVIHLLESKGLSVQGKGFFTKMKLPDVEFVKRYVVPHKDAIPELYGIFLAGCAS